MRASFKSNYSIFLFVLIAVHFSPYNNVGTNKCWTLEWFKFSWVFIYVISSTGYIQVSVCIYLEVPQTLGKFEGQICSCNLLTPPVDDGPWVTLDSLICMHEFGCALQLLSWQQTTWLVLYYHLLITKLCIRDFQKTCFLVSLMEALVLTWGFWLSVAHLALIGLDNGILCPRRL